MWGANIDASLQVCAMGFARALPILRFSALLASKNPARLDGRVAEIAEHTIDAKLIELEIFVDWIALVVGGKSMLLVAKSPSVNQKSGTMCVVDQL